jgi:hypothetical protein
MAHLAQDVAVGTRVARVEDARDARGGPGFCDAQTARVERLRIPANQLTRNSGISRPAAHMALQADFSAPEAQGTAGMHHP